MNGRKLASKRMLATLIAAGALVRAATALSAGAPTVDGQTFEVPNSCMQQVFGGATVTSANLLNCTANDIRLSRATSVSPTSCLEGTTFDLTATFQTAVTANSRYDAAFFFRIDGGNTARGTVTGGRVSGACSVTQLLANQATAADGVLNLNTILAATSIQGRTT